MIHGPNLRDKTAQHCFGNSDVQDAKLDRSVAQIEDVRLEAAPGLMYVPIDCNAQVAGVVDIPMEVHELVRLLVYLTVCLNIRPARGYVPTGCNDRFLCLFSYA